jgi:hypothetical protein
VVAGKANVSRRKIASTVNVVANVLTISLDYTDIGLAAPNYRKEGEEQVVLTPSCRRSCVLL